MLVCVERIHFYVSSRVAPQENILNINVIFRALVPAVTLCWDGALFFVQTSVGKVYRHLERSPHPGIRKESDYDKQRNPL